MLLTFKPSGILTVESLELFKWGNPTKNEHFCVFQVPAFETADGKCLVEGNAIAYYLASEDLRGGKDSFNQAEVQQWMSFADNEILPASCAWVFPLLGIMPYEAQAVNRSKEDVTAVLKLLNSKLLLDTYLVGERITLADIVVFCNLLHLYQYVLEPSLRTQYASVTRWFLTILNQPQVQKVVENFELCAKTLKHDPKRFAEFQKKCSELSAPPAEPKKEETKQKEKEKEAEDGEEQIHEEKSKDPFDLLPKGTFNMDAFKRFYSNEDEAKSIPYFWEKFDPENYSIWFGEYKYNNELTKVFMSCNLITGMFQRLDKMRKQAFASVCLFGEDNNSTISGLWVWRGKDLAFTLSPDWQIDYDCYDWKKLDPSSEETKKLVANYFSWTGTDKDGRKFNQGKIFK